MNVKIQGDLWFFPVVSMPRYIFPGGKLEQLTFSGWEVFRYQFFPRIKSIKIQFQGIYKSNNHSFQDVLVFKNLVVHTPVWMKNEIAHFVGNV